MEFPWQYNFPPFFTIQPNEDTRKKQIDAWCDLVLAYCKQKRIYQLDIADSLTSELFSNKKIDRKCSPELATLIIEELVKRNRAEWIPSKADSSSSLSSRKSNQQAAAAASSNSRKCFVYWNSLSEWANLIYKYVCDNAMQNTVCTFYELTESSDCQSEEFFRIDSSVLLKVLGILQQQKKAEVISLDGAGDHGVKFF
jgi:ESCRT-II complex subunit VPS25